MKRSFLLCLMLILGGALLTGCGKTIPTPERWQQIGQFQVRSLNLMVGFWDETLGISVGEDGQNVYTHDGGQTWSEAENDSMGLYGLEILDSQHAFSCGTGMGTRLTTDGGATWQLAGNFGGNYPTQCRFMSFVDVQTGWAATPVMLGATIDGAAHWAMLFLPTGIDDISAISLIAAGQGFLLDAAGRLYATTDNSLTWTQAGQLPLGKLTISKLSYPSAAMRFRDPLHGMVLISAIVDGAGQVVAFQTDDGGASWSQEVVPVTYGVPYLSLDGRLLTMLTPPYTVTVVKYNGE